MGDPVRIINFTKHAKDKWLPGVVTDKHGPLTYLITLDDGRIFRRHLDHIRLRTNCITNIGTPHPVVGVPNAIISEDYHHPMIQLVLLVVNFRVVLNIILLSNYRNIVNINYIVYLKRANVVYQPLTFTYSDT